MVIKNPKSEPLSKAPILIKSIKVNIKITTKLMPLNILLFVILIRILEITLGLFEKLDLFEVPAIEILDEIDARFGAWLDYIPDGMLLFLLVFSIITLKDSF